MVPYRLIPLLAILHQINNVFSTLQSGELKIQVNDGEDSISSCQTCILDSLGATRMKLKSYTSNAFDSVATYEILGSNFVFANLRLDCDSKEKCIIKKLTMSSCKQWRTMVSEEPVISLDKLSQYILTSKFSASVLCMACLQENAAARSIGKFWIIAVTFIHHIFYVFEDSKTIPYVGTCKAYCPDLAVQEETAFILELVRQLPFKKTQKSPLFNVPNASDAILSPQSIIQCLQPQKLLTTPTTIEDCRSCVALNYNKAVVSTQINLKLMLYIFATRWEDRTELVKCPEKCGLIRVLQVTHANCRIPMNNHFLTFPDGEQMLGPPLKNVKVSPLTRKLSSGCVWAIDGGQYFSCSECLRTIEALNVQELSGSTSLISIHPLKHQISDDRIGKLGECVFHHNCKKLLFVPNAMCLYESEYLRLGTVPHSYALLKDRRNPNMPTKRVSQFKRASPEDFHSSSFSSKYMGTQHHNGPGADHLLHAGLLVNKNWLTLGPSSTSPVYTGAQKQDNLRSEHQPQSLLDADTHWLPLVSNHDNSKTNVIVVHWSENHQACVWCLALHGEVLLFSVKRSYAWMIEDPYPVIKCDVCGHLTKENAMALDVFSLKPISRSDIESFYNDLENDCCSTTERE